MLFQKGEKGEINYLGDFKVVLSINVFVIYSSEENALRPNTFDVLSVSSCFLYVVF